MGICCGFSRAARSAKVQAQSSCHPQQLGTVLGVEEVRDRDARDEIEEDLKVVTHFPFKKHCFFSWKDRWERRFPVLSSL